MKKGLFHATFKESLKLKKNDFIKWIVEETTQPPYILIFLVPIFLIAVNYGLMYICTQLVRESYENSIIAQPHINFLPEWLFYVFFATAILFWLCSHVCIRRNKSNNLIWLYLNANYLVMWLGLEVVLLCVTATYQFYPIWFWMFILILSVLIMSILIIKYTINLKKLLFSKKEYMTTYYMLKIMKKLVQFFILIIIGYLLIRLLYPSIIKSSHLPIEILGVIIFAFVSIFVCICLELYMIWPYALYFYYKTKYVEEYRKLEGKMQIEWYGYKYYKKYIKDTELDEDKNKGKED